jgi:RNA polymerase sigma factor (sigma-70 family)
MSDITQILDAAAGGDPKAAAQIWPLVYDELRRLAVLQLAHESPGQTLQPTALVHEAYLRLVREEGQQHSLAEPPTEKPETRGERPSVWRSRGQFFAAAAEAMRHILIDQARRKRSQKRGGGRARQDLDPDHLTVPEAPDDLLALDEALSQLAAAEPQVAQLVQLRYFAGLTLRQAAAALGIAPRTADVWWAYARAWLLDKLQDGVE